MILRLMLFILGYSILLLIPGAGLAFLGYKALKPKYQRHKALKAAEWRAKQLALGAVDNDRQCSICLDPVDIDQDCFERPHGWFHADCMTKLLKGEGP